MLVPFANAMDLSLGTAGSLGERAEVRTYTSVAVSREQPYLVIWPEGEIPAAGWPVMFVLHGHGRHHRTLWEKETTQKELMRQPFLLVMPDTGSGWYVDSPVNPASRYEAALDELIEIVARDLPVAAERKAWGITGWSMGGYGAVRNGARRNERFSFVGSIIGLLDFPRTEGLPEGQRYRIPRGIFGDDRTDWARLNPVRMVGDLTRTRMVVVVADQAFDRTMNENFIAAAADEQVSVEVVRLSGGHTFPVVAEALPHVLLAARRHFGLPAEAH